MDYLGLEKLPIPEQDALHKCVVLVERINGVKDYAIAQERRIIADIGFTAPIVSIIEYYPTRREKKEVIEVEQPIIQNIPILPKKQIGRPMLKSPRG